MTKYAPLKPLFLRMADIEAVAPSRREIIGIVEQTYRCHAEGTAEVPAKIGLHPLRPNAFLHAMPAMVGGTSAFGAKIVTYFPGNYDHGFQDSTAIILLYDCDNGQPLAIMEGMWITFARTAACAAIAAKYLAPPQATSLGLVGCGGLGYWSLVMLSEVLPNLKEVYVASRTPDSRKRFCDRMAQEGPWHLQDVDCARDAVENSDIVVSSTPQQVEPRIMGSWWNPGTLAIPLDYPYSWDDEAFALAERIVTDDMTTIRRYEDDASTGPRPNLRMPAKVDDLADVVVGRASGRDREDERILVFITGIASTDLTVAMEVYRRARAAGIGQELTLD